MTLLVPTLPSCSPGVQNARHFLKPCAGKALCTPSDRSLSLDPTGAAERASGWGHELLVWQNRPGSIPGRNRGQRIGSRVYTARGETSCSLGQPPASASGATVQVPDSPWERQSCITLKACLQSCWLRSRLELGQRVCPVFREIAEIFWIVA